MPSILTPKAIPSARKPFRDTNYATWLGNQRLYSLSKVLRELGLKPDYGDADPSVIQRAACRGKLTEQYCYRLLQGKPVTVRDKHCGSLREDVAVRVEAFYRWMVRTKPEFVDCQTFAWSEQDRICWQRDLRVIIDGRLTLVDVKCTSKAEKDWPLQIGCGLSYDEDGAERGGVLHLNPRLNKDGFKFREYNADSVKGWWRRAADRWRSNRDFNLLRAELGFDSEAIGFEVEDGD